MGSFEEILHQNEVGLTVTHDFGDALHGIKVHHGSGGEGFHDRWHILTHHSHGFDDSSDQGYLNRIDQCGAAEVTL
jgi:hypothetical protein